MARAETVYFDAVLAPNPPLSRGALFLVLFVISAVGFALALFFALRGAWPVTPFLGADVALLACALHASMRASRRRERLTLTSGRLLLKRIDSRGRETVIEANPYWMRVEHEDPERLGAELALVSRGKRLVVGRFLGADERASLAEALVKAIGRARASA
ncbi:MAG: DUF2244 domain-containing protein [Alphaproteobacteria bacterium]